MGTKLKSIMRSLSLILVLVVTSILLSVQAQFNPSESAFQDGEWFQMRIHFGIFNTAFATFELTRKEFDGRDVYHAEAFGKTTGIFRWFFKVDDDYQSYFGVKSGLPYYFIRDIDENGYTKDVRIRFDQENKMAYVNDLKHSKKFEIPLQGQVQDLISCFYFLRNNLPQKLEVNQMIDLNMFFDQENYVFRLKYLGEDTLKTRFGKIDCLKFRPYVKSGRIFKAEESMTLWITSDDNKLPIRLQANLSVGNIKVDIHAFRNLAHPFVINVD